VSARDRAGASTASGRYASRTRDSGEEMAPTEVERALTAGRPAPMSAADVNLLRRADAAGQRLFRELVAKRIAWATVSEVSRLIAVDVVAVSLPAPGCEHPRPCVLAHCLDRLEMRAVLGNRAARLPGLYLPAGSGVGGKVLATGMPFSVADYLEAPFDSELVDLVAREEGIAALLAVPISFGGVVRGVLHAGLRRPGRFGAGPTEALSRVATYAGAALAAAGDRARVEDLARMRERRRMVRALHDDFNQRLFGVGISARRARESAVTGHPDLMTRLQRLEQEVARTVASLRATLTSLDAPPGHMDVLALTLSEDVAAFQHRTGLPAHLLVLGDPTPVDAARTELLVRVVREGLRNVERHAGASEVVVTLRADGALAEVAVQDDGVGPGGARLGLGLTTLRDELSRLDGGLRLVCGDDPGATLRAWLALP
jgi:LuxR family transcriptional regulator, regulator of acetate metabolism